MKWPNKLVCVGMRFLPKEQVASLDKYRNSSSNKKNASIVLAVESNDNGELDRYGEHCAVRVIIDRQHVAYVRNADLSKDFIDLVRAMGHKAMYELSSVSTNYFVLVLKEDANITASNVYSTTIDTTSNLNANITANAVQAAYWNNNSNTTEKITVKETGKMMNTNSMRDSFFREVKNVAIDIQSGKFGVTSAEGISVYVDGGVTVNPIQDFGVKIPAFAMRVAVNDLKEGDIILNGNDASFFKSKNDKGYEVVTLSGEVKQVGNVTNLFFGKNTVLAVRNMFGDNMNPLMMAMMMGDGKEFDMKTFALMSMMGGNNGGMDSNMLMMAMMMGK